VETGVVEPAYGDFEPAVGRLPVLDARAALEVARVGVLVDARAPERFRGEVEPYDPVAGHVPGAVNVPSAWNLVTDGPRAGRFKSVEELRGTYDAVVRAAATEADAGSSPPVGVYCGSGVTATHDALALELLGVEAAVYPGSWSEYVTDAARPVATGG
jgi:thiosulfate/3-mercaptopyruvate sulfurtransferase